MSPLFHRLRRWLRGWPPLRFAYAVGVAGSIVGGYKLLEWRYRLRLGVPDLDAATRRHHEAGARRVYRGAVRLQGLMIKVGQTIGSNPAAVPLEYISVLSSLQDAVPPRPWREMRPAIERALGRPVGAAFAAFDRRPVAAASLAQVYRARLHDGRLVAVKVLYPGIERLVDSDLRVLRFLLWLDARFGSYPLESIYQELAANVPLETDLVHEGQAMEAIAAALAAQPRVVIPRVVWKHTSRTLLVMDWIDGIKVTEQARLLAAGIDVQAVADLIVDVYTRMVLQQGFFHADPHAGNLFALPGDRLAIVDFGLTKRLTPAFRRSLAKLTRAMFTADTARLLEAYAELGFEARDADDHQVFIATAEFFRTITDPATYVQGEGAMRSLNEDWARAVKANPITAFPGDLTLVSRVFSLLTGVGARMGAEPRVLPAILRYTVGDDPPPPSEARLTEGAPT